MQLPWKIEECTGTIPAPKSWRINVVGLGDVGGTMVTGLRLLGRGIVSEIGLFGGGNSETEKRWEYEAGQVRRADRDEDNWPQLRRVAREELFDCDMFIFCASVGVPPLGQEKKDVRLAQLEGNARLVAGYAKQAREEGFAGLFSVVSDPVDQLCYAALSASNRDVAGIRDNQGLKPQQIRGYGLGVMHARAAFYAERDPRMAAYLTQGAAYGPHGQGLVIINSLEEYDDALSQELTTLTTKANLVVRETGFKPFVAPALSSGTLSLLDTMTGAWHYSAVHVQGAFLGMLNRYKDGCNHMASLNLPELAVQRIMDTHAQLVEWSVRLDNWMDEGMPEGGI